MADELFFPSAFAPVSLTTQDDTATLAPKNEAKVDVKKKKLWTDFQARIDACKAYRRKLIANWTQNIDYRRGKPFASQTDEDRIAVNLDWSLTKSKQAQLFSQIPQVHVNHPPQTGAAGPWLQAFEQRLNDTLIVAGIETAMDECLPDVINAAGIGAVMCSHESLIEMVDVPGIDMKMLPPEQAAQVEVSGMMPDGTPVPMTQIPRVVDHRYLVQRISPADLLWPITFTGADFDNAPWIGRSGRVSWPQAQQLWGLKDEEKEQCSTDQRTSQDRLTHDIDKDKITSDNTVSFDEIFYKEFEFDSKATNYTALHHLIFITGKDEPVVDEPWKGQKPDTNPQAAAPRFIGALKSPIRVLTLTYISDETIPPSDSAIGRPQVNEINKARTQMVQQRERSLPFRWADINRIDPTVLQGLMRGTWQTIVPVQGAGTNVIGEVARPSMPNEDFTFNQIAMDDLASIWQTGPNQQGNFAAGRQSASEANVVQENFTTRIGRERAKVAKLFVSIAEVLGGLIALYEPATSFGEGFDPAISKTLAYSILADSTVLIDSNQRLERLMKFIDFGAKSGYVSIEPVFREIATLSGLDPNIVIVPPTPAPPVEPNISLRLTGSEDMNNPLTLAMLIKSGQAPSSEQIAQAAKLIMESMTPLPHPPGFLGAGKQEVPAPGMPPGGMPPPAGAQMGTPQAPITPPPPPTPEIGEAHSGWGLIPKVGKRQAEEGGGTQ